MTIIDKKYYNYIYLDPRKKGIFKYPKLFKIDIQTIYYFEPFYVGRGCGNRMFRGLRNNKSNLFKKRILDKIYKCGLTPIIIKLNNNLTIEEACRYEKIIIKTIGRRDNKTGYLSNLTDGGEGVSNIIVSKETRDKISKTLKETYIKNPELIENNRLQAIGNRYNFGKKHTEKTKKLISLKGKGRKDSVITKERKSKAFKGRKYSLEHNIKISNALRGKKLSEDRIKKLSIAHLGQKAINCIKVRNIETNEIFESLYSASKKHRVDRHNIAKCCKKLKNTCGGFHWEYANK